MEESDAYPPFESFLELTERYIDAFSDVTQGLGAAVVHQQAAGRPRPEVISNIVESIAPTWCDGLRDNECARFLESWSVFVESLRHAPSLESDHPLHAIGDGLSRAAEEQRTAQLRAVGARVINLRHVAVDEAQ